MAYLRFLCWFCVLFFPVYAGVGYWHTRVPPQALRLYADWELALPLWPLMVWPYLTLYSLFLLPFFHLDDAGLRRLTRQSMVVLMVAGLCFVVLPAQRGYPPPPADLALQGLSGWVLAGVGALDTPFNLVPSLHVAFATLIVLACAARASRALRAVYGLWWLLLSASALLVHQHHVLDVVSGAALAWAVHRFWPMPSEPLRPRGEDA